PLARIRLVLVLHGNHPGTGGSIMRERTAFWRAIDGCPDGTADTVTTAQSSRSTATGGVGGTQVAAWTVLGAAIPGPARLRSPSGPSRTRGPPVIMVVGVPLGTQEGYLRDTHNCRILGNGASTGDRLVSRGAAGR
ncbi:MAG: hypothetical protein ACRDRJ_30970, partial [Streptosporangiaceae bacterium]